MAPALRDSRDDTFDLGVARRPAPRPARPALVEKRIEAALPAEADRPEPPSPEAAARAAEHASAERMLRGALLVGLLLNLAAFLGVGLSLPLGPLSRADALLGAVTLAAAVAMLALGELCRRGEPPSFRR
jgi:hypothetical protein